MINTIPHFEILSSASRALIIEKAYDLLHDPGFFLYSKTGLEILANRGAKVDFKKSRVRVNSDIINKALSTAPPSFTQNDHNRKTKFEIKGANQYFGTMGTVIFVQDYDNEKIRRKPITKDFVEHNIIFEDCEYLSVQGGPFVCVDVPKEVADTYRLLLCMLFTVKPTMATNFSPEGYHYMKEMLAIMADEENDIVQRPSHAFRGERQTSPRQSGESRRDR